MEGRWPIKLPNKKRKASNLASKRTWRRSNCQSSFTRLPLYKIMIAFRSHRYWNNSMNLKKWYKSETTIHRTPEKIWKKSSNKAKHILKGILERYKAVMKTQKARIDSWNTIWRTIKLSIQRRWSCRMSPPICNHPFSTKIVQKRTSNSMISARESPSF